MDEDTSATGGLKNTLILALIQSLESPDPQVREGADVALIRMGRYQVLDSLICSIHTGSSDGKWAAIHGIYTLMRSCQGPGPVRMIIKRLQEEIDGLGPSNGDQKKKFVGIVLTKLIEASEDVILKKEQELRSILSEGRPKPPRFRRVTPSGNHKVAPKRLSSPHLRRIGRSSVTVPRLKGH